MTDADRKYKEFSTYVDGRQRSMEQRLRMMPIITIYLWVFLALTALFASIDGYFAFIRLTRFVHSAGGDISSSWAAFGILASIALVTGLAAGFDQWMEHRSWSPWITILGVSAAIAAFSWSGGSLLKNDIQGIDPNTGLPFQPGEFKSIVLMIVGSGEIFAVIVFFLLTALSLKAVRVNWNKRLFLKQDAIHVMKGEESKSKANHLRKTSNTGADIAKNNHLARAFDLSKGIYKYTVQEADRIDEYLRGALPKDDPKNHGPINGILDEMVERSTNPQELLSQELKDRIDLAVPEKINFSSFPPADQLSASARKAFREAEAHLRNRYSQNKLYEELLA